MKAATPYLVKSFIQVGIVEFGLYNVNYLFVFQAIPALHSYLSSQSLHRMRSYNEMAQSLVLRPSEVPKMFDVHFRVIVRLTDWLVKDNACVYPFIQDLTRSVKNGQVKEPTETDITLLNHY